MKKTIITVGLLIMAGLYASAQENQSDENFDSLFKDEDMVEEIIEESETTPEEVFLVSEVMEWGGKVISSFESNWMWIGGYPALNDLFKPDICALDINFGASLFFDARPKEDFRVFGKLKALYPFDFSTGSPEVSIVELFSDFDYKNLLFFRVGKHTIKWGEGFFFSPADMLNITPIDPANPEAEREGPLSVRTHVPLNVHNMYLYLIASDKTTRPDEIAVAPKFEFLLGNLETGIGVFYKKGLSPKAVVMATLPVWNFDFFGEAVVSYGSDKNFIERTGSPPGVIAVQKSEDWFFSGTAGFNLIIMEPSVSVIGQYLYNGEGYVDSDVLKEPGIATLIAGGQLSSADLLMPGRHYCALSANWSSIFDSDFGVSIFWMGNLTDGSGQVTPQISWKLFDYTSLSINMPIFYGEEGDEYTPLGKALSVSLTASPGGGKKF